MKLPVFKIFKLSFANVWHNRQEWAHVLFAPWAVLIIYNLFLVLCYIKTGEGVYDKAVSAPTTVFLLQLAIGFSLSIIVMSQMIINSLRYALLKEGGNRWWTLHFNPRFFKLVLYYILFILIIALVTGIVSGASGFVADLHTMNTTPGIARRTYILARYILAGGGILVALGAIYLTIRLSLYSLFIATDQKRPFRSSWHLLKKNVWRFLGIIVLVILAVYIPSFALTYLVKMISTNHFITITTTIISSLFFTPLMMAVMSKAGALVYQTLEKGKTLK